MGLFTATKSDKAKTKKVKEEGCVVTLSVEIPAQEVADQTQTALVRLQNRARIPGFRAPPAACFAGNPPTVSSVSSPPTLPIALLINIIMTLAI